MNIKKLITALNYAWERKTQAESNLNMTSLNEPELIDANIFECRAWEERCKYLNRKIKEAFKNGQAILR